jgi:hypothetical protein
MSGNTSKTHQGRKMLQKALSLAVLFVFLFIPATEAFGQSVFGNTQPGPIDGGGSLSLSPNNGEVIINETFDLSVFLNTNEHSINTIELNIKYPPDKLQMVSSSTGKSIIGIWTSLPKYNNQEGTISLVGGIPNGISVSNGLVSTFTFRAKTVGRAVVKFEKTRVLLNDGLGTELPTQNNSSIFDLILPPPAGPTVISSTHPDQTKWYRDTNAYLSWSDEDGAEGFSYTLSNEPIETPDSIAEGLRFDTVYKNLSEGRHYFHIRTLRGGQWGGTTHYALNIDPNPPAEFVIEIIPSAKTTRRQPVFEFATTDTTSGLSHYELRVVPMNRTNAADSEVFFIEASSPYISNNLELGSYDVIVRAYDQAGNFIDITRRLEITNSILRFISDKGLEVRSWLIIPWWVFLLILLVIIGIFYLTIRKLNHWHKHMDERRASGEFPSYVQKQLEELQQYRARYGKIAMVILMISLTMGLASTALAQDSVISPPVISTVSRNISDEEIFYIGGRTDAGNTEVAIFLQNTQTASTISQVVKSDKAGEWFYRHDGFLSPGNYQLWAQAKLGNLQSPPSPQIDLVVESTAFRVGAARLSYTTLYLILAVFMAILCALMLLAIIIRYSHGRRKHKVLIKEIEEAEASVRRGFAVLNRDIQSELEIIRKAKMSQSVSEEERRREEQLLKDLAEIEQYVSKEIWDIEEVERVGKA